MNEKDKQYPVQCDLPDSIIGRVPRYRYRPQAQQITGQERAKRRARGSDAFFSLIIYPTVGIGTVYFCTLPINNYLNIRQNLPEGWEDLQGAFEFLSNLSEVEVWAARIRLGDGISKKGGCAFSHFEFLSSTIAGMSGRSRFSVDSDCATTNAATAKPEQARLNL